MNQSVIGSIAKFLFLFIVNKQTFMRGQAWQKILVEKVLQKTATLLYRKPPVTVKHVSSNGTKSLLFLYTWV